MDAMDQRLREIERELGTGGDAPSEGVTAKRQTIVRPLPKAREGSVAWPRSAATVGEPGPVVDDRRQRPRDDPHEQAAAIIARAHAEAARIVGAAAERAAELGRDIDHLRRLREELEAAVADATPIDALPADTLFRGEIALSAGPFADIATLGTFERAVAALPDVVEARVRGFEGDRAVLDVLLGAPVRLLEEMEHGLEWDFMLERSDAESVAIRLLDGSADA